MKLWAGRFEKNTDKAVDSFHSSLPFDIRLITQDIKGSIAHAHMLGKIGILAQQESESIIKGLQGILEDWLNGSLELDDSEDVHMYVEAILTDRIGENGKKLHTGRSRNDQVALDMRMYMKEACQNAVTRICALNELLLKIAKENTQTVMPGYTHMQKAQPITLAHHAMAYFWMFSRDAQRFIDCYKRTDYMPLGSGALAGTTYPLDRQMVADELKFSHITLNSLDGVSDRDFCLEYLFCASTAMMHLSRYCEELILWSTDEFGFAQMDDAFSTGSSIMPQKKNPDVAELIRGKIGRVYGSLMSLLTIMKSLPMAYDKDMQEDKEGTFDAVDTLESCLSIFTGMLATVQFNAQRMLKGASGGFTNATDLADYLAKKGMPFRTAHEVSGKTVLYCIKHGKALLDLSLDELKGFSELFEEDVYEDISLKECLNRRKLPGGPAPEAVNDAISAGESQLSEIRGWLKK